MHFPNISALPGYRLIKLRLQVLLLLSVVGAQRAALVDKYKLPLHTKGWELLTTYWGYIGAILGIMEHEMETTMVYWGYIGVILKTRCKC